MANYSKNKRSKNTKTLARSATFSRFNFLKFFSSPTRILIFMLAFANVGVALLLFASATSPLMANFEPAHSTLVNNHRAANGRAALSRSKCLTNAARAHSQHMADTGVFAHSSGQTFYANYCPGVTTGIMVSWGENISSYASPTPPSGEQLAQISYDSFKNSPPHDANMLNPAYHYVGYGAAYIKVGTWYNYYITQIFVQCSSGCNSEWTSPPAEVTSGGSGAYTGISVAKTTDSGSPGFWILKNNGAVTAHGGAKWYGDLIGKSFSGWPVEIASPDFGGGYWIVTSNGAVYGFGSAKYYGGANGLSLKAPIVGIAPVKGGKGYWLVGADGGIFSYGSASFYGSAGSLTLNKPIVGMAAYPGGGGYWLVAADGGIFSYGTAKSHFYGSMGGKTLNAPIIGMASNTTGSGYRLLGTDGGIFSFGNVTYYGSAAGKLSEGERATGLSITADGKGYWIITNYNRTFKFGDAFY